ncbi:MAG TPA: depupylase/deamidase Dop [Acidimicrobiia bacterium]|nr:depupylase/deamidase Dop [Acidimicrobiia bacterium]
MALHKVLGTETEYGIVVRGDPGFNPAVASSLVVNNYPGARVKVQWSYEEESPGRDARGFGHDSYGLIDPEGAVVNSVLANGARLYVDHAHPEYSGPETYDPLEAALYDKAGEVVMHRAAVAASEAAGRSISLYKNNSDGKGNSYGAHENYLLSRETPFGDLIRYAMTFMVTRQIFTGAGKVGKENDRADVDFQITQRADFFEEEVGLETTLKRPIINTRDEPHGDPSLYRRLHVIIGDANLSEYSNFLKLGTTALMLAALEDGAIPDPLDLFDPVEACWQVSHDIALGRPLDLDGGGTATALELQGRYLEWLSKYAEKELDDPVWDRVIEEWARTLELLDTNPDRLADTLDWVAKKRLLEGYVSRDGLQWTNNKLRALDLQYHDVDPDKGLYNRLASRGSMRRLFTDEEIVDAISNPPTRTRAYFRGRCVSEFAGSLVAANWDSLVFDVGEPHLKRVPMMEPLRGDASLVGELLDEAEDAADLLRRLEG